MRQWIRAHLTYANVMVTILAFVVLGGGTAMAAYVVSSNSQVGPATISGHRPPTGKQANIIPGSVNGVDLASPVVTEGGITQTSAATIVNTTLIKELTADCPPGTKVTGGGYVLGGVSQDENVVAVRNYAVDANTWLVRAEAPGIGPLDTPPDWSLTVVVDCAG